MAREAERVQASARVRIGEHRRASEKMSASGQVWQVCRELSEYLLRVEREIVTHRLGAQRPQLGLQIQQLRQPPNDQMAVISPRIKIRRRRIHDAVNHRTAPARIVHGDLAPAATEGAGEPDDGERRDRSGRANIAQGTWGECRMLGKTNGF